MIQIMSPQSIISENWKIWGIDSMNDEGKKTPDWGSEEQQEELKVSRQDLWSRYFVRFIAEVAGLKPGIVLLDVGSGIGFLADTFTPFIEPDGWYIGVDEDERLVERCVEESVVGREYLVGDALDTPIEDGSVDVAMCQTLLMHLDEPERAIEEMMRVVNAGGRVFALEPDNLDGLTMGYSTVYEPDIDELVEDVKRRLIAERGRQKIAGGDYSLGSKVPVLFNKVGLKDIQVYRTDKVECLLPPYDTERKKRTVERFRYYISVEKKERDLGMMRENLVAGGGTEEDVKRMERRNEEMVERFKEQLESGELAFVHPINLYFVVGRKP